MFFLKIVDMLGLFLQIDSLTVDRHRWIPSWYRHRVVPAERFPVDYPFNVQKLMYAPPSVPSSRLTVCGLCPTVHQHGQSPLRYRFVRYSLVLALLVLGMAGCNASRQKGNTSTTDDTDTTTLVSEQTASGDTLTEQPDQAAQVNTDTESPQPDNRSSQDQPVASADKPKTETKGSVPEGPVTCANLDGILRNADHCKDKQVELTGEMVTDGSCAFTSPAGSQPYSRSSWAFRQGGQCVYVFGGQPGEAAFLDDEGFRLKIQAQVRLIKDRLYLEYSP